MGAWVGVGAQMGGSCGAGEKGRRRRDSCWLSGVVWFVFLWVFLVFL